MKEEPTEAIEEGETKGRKGEKLETSDVPGVRTRRGRKRKPGTVVDLLVSSYSRKRSSRCKVGPYLVPEKLTLILFFCSRSVSPVELRTVASASSVWINPSSEVPTRRRTPVRRVSV